MTQKLQDFLDRKVREYNTVQFIPEDPVAVPHRFTRPQDIEIAGFFTALFSWGHRRIIINKSLELMARMDNAPHDFCRQHSEAELKKLLQFRHRTFNPTDLLFLVGFLKQHYSGQESLESAFTFGLGKNDPSVENGLNGFYNQLFAHPDAPPRTRKHIAAPQKNSSCKRLNMYLRWMVRKDNKGVDFGLWKNIRPSQLVCPLDVHVARVARHFGLLQRPAVDWKAAMELTENLKKMDPKDPVKYDFALFGLGVVEKF